MRNRYILLADLLLIPVIAYSAFVLRFDWRVYVARDEYLSFVVAALVLKPVVFHLFGMYRRYWRYASVADLLALTLAAAASTIVMGIFITARATLSADYQFSRAVLLLDGLLTLLALGGVRLSVRVISESRRPRATEERRAPTGRRRVLIVGAGQAGTMMAREMERNQHLGIVAVGYLDDDRTKVGKQIQGLRVFGTTKDMADIVEKFRVDEVLIAMPTAPGTLLRSIAENARQLGVASRTMPGVFELLDGNVSVSRLREIDIADLLRRSQVTPAFDASGYVEGKVVLVTGAGGSIGSELCRQIGHGRPKAIVLLGHGENSIFQAQVELTELYPDLRIMPVIADIRNRRRIRRTFARLRPHIVFHAAAHKHVPMMEDNPEEAISNNVVGTHNVVEAAIESGAERFVLISSDKAVAPSSVMGASKRMAEMIVREAGRRTSRSFVVVRFGNVLGSRGSVVPHFKRQIERGGPITLTDPEMTRFFMTISEAVHLVLVAGGFGRGGEVFVLRMGDPVRITDLAEDLIKLSGFNREDIPIMYTGIRPGEKLSESLWEDGATTEPTPHLEVLRVLEPGDERQADVTDIVRDLAMAADDEDEFRIQTMLVQHIPTFAPYVKMSSH